MADQPPKQPAVSDRRAPVSDREREPVSDRARRGAASKPDSPSRISAAITAIRRHPTGSVAFRTTIAVLGGLVVALGLVLVPLPGPGWLIVFFGLSIWAVEFVWAQRLLHFTRTQLERWWHWLGRQHMAVRLLAGLIGLVFVTTVVLVSLRYSFGINALGSFWTFITTH